jgi:hypothetical protein
MSEVIKAFESESMRKLILSDFPPETVYVQKSLVVYRDGETPATVSFDKYKLRTVSLSSIYQVEVDILDLIGDVNGKPESAFSQLVTDKLNELVNGGLISPVFKVGETLREQSLKTIEIDINTMIDVVEFKLSVPVTFYKKVSN